jgi:hypothetical protein
VRIHTDHDAVESARSINSLAYSVGNNIIFGEGQYVPYINTGKRLIGHELGHVIQQRDQIIKPHNKTTTSSFN